MCYGLSAVTNHGVPDELLEQQFRESAAFFALPLQEKLRLQVDQLAADVCANQQLPHRLRLVA